MVRGSLILLEGLDRTGKSTQADLIVNDFVSANKKVELMKFPSMCFNLKYTIQSITVYFLTATAVFSLSTIIDIDRETPIGKLINEYLTSEDFQIPKESIHLLFSANRWEMKDVILEKLNKGINIVMDRYYYSGIAYSSANGLDFDWCKAPDVGLPAPDLTLFLTFQKEKSVVDLQERGNYGEERYEKVDFQQKVKHQFGKLFNPDANNDQKDVGAGSQNEIVYVDNKSIQEVHQLVFKHIEKFIQMENDRCIHIFK